jgi:chemotaxis protein methyltransferase CheR
MAAIQTEDYEFIRQLVYQHSRINLGSDKAELVSSRVQKRLRALGLNSIETYCEFLRSPDGGQEMTDLLDVISTNVTDFFREAAHFEFLNDVVIPDWLKHGSKSSDNVFRTWSAACSSGEEPYSIAITLAEFFRQRRGYEWRVEASDLSTRVLERGGRGVYRAERVKLPSSDWLGRYFQCGVGDSEGYYRVKKELQVRVKFRHLNLFDWPYPFTEKMQVIFCRNVMIYFNRETQDQLVPRLADQLVPGGYLFVGHSESLIGLDHKLKCVHPSVYRRE